MSDLVIRDARIFDGVADGLTTGDVRISDGVISEVGVVSDAPAEVVDAAGRVLTPGLIDAHFHAYAVALDSESIEHAPLSYVALAAQSRLADSLYRGFTTVRDPAGGDSGLARAIDEGLVVAPRYLYTGSALSQTGGHGDYRAADSLECFHGGHTVDLVDGVENLRVAVRERFRTGAHAIKIFTSGGVITPTDPIRVPQYSAEEIRAVTDEAKRRGSYVAAHAYSPEAIVHSVVNGVRSIEHGNLLDRASAEVMREHGAFLVPTMGAYDAMDRLGEQLGLSEIAQFKNRQVLAAAGDSVRIAHEAGVPVGFGSDNMGGLITEQLVGVRLLADATNVWDALRSVTSVNAALLQRDDLGRVAVGAVGDVVLWDDDPTVDIDAIADSRRSRTVVFGGVVVASGGTR